VRSEGEVHDGGGKQDPRAGRRLRRVHDERVDDDARGDEREGERRDRMPGAGAISPGGCGSRCRTMISAPAVRPKNSQSAKTTYDSS
jgi:hypothetical protein